jgi:ABC-2 type transport system ATP-binding protein
MGVKMDTIIKVHQLVKDFKVPKKDINPSLAKKLWSIFYREWETKRVLKHISFEVKKGEFIGYVGPNGAGKSTTIKILTGVLTPTEGEVQVAGFVPYKQRYEYTYHIGVVFGNRSLLEFDIPVIDSFRLYRDIYELNPKTFQERLDLFSEILKIDQFLHIPVRKLSLGERMRCEIAASLLHKPEVVFLDEPTIGLDVLAKEEIRNFLTRINREDKTTIMLTTHDMNDIEALCERILIIDEGRIIYDGPLTEIKRKYVQWKRIEFEYHEIKNPVLLKEILKKTRVLEQRQKFVSLEVNTLEQDVPDIIGGLLNSLDITDLNVQEPRLESVIKEIYRRGMNETGQG